MSGHGPDDELRRSLGVRGAGAFVVSNMVGTGIFTVPAFVRTATGGGLSALAVWAAGAMLALFGAFCYAELATRMPRAGGEYHYLTRVFGPLWGFLSGWISFVVGFSAAVAAAALAAVAYVAPLIPAWDPSTPLMGGTGPTQGAAVAAAVVVLFALVHATGVRPSGRLQTTFALAVLAGIGVLVAAGFASGRGTPGWILARSGGGSSWWVALIEVTFAYSGWNAAAYLAGEVREPSRTLPRALLGGTLAVAAAYLALNLLFLFAMPPESWGPTIDIGRRAAVRLFGDGAGRIVGGLIGLAILGSVSAMTAAGPRVYYAMGRDGLAPPLFRRVADRSGAPVVAIGAQAAMAAALALTGAFEALLIYVGSVLLLFAGLAVAAVYVVRRRGERAAGAFRVPGYPVTPAVFLGFVVVAWSRGLVERPVPTLAALASVGVGIGVYALGRRRGWLEPTMD